MSRLRNGVLALLLVGLPGMGADMPSGSGHVNSSGMRLARIEAGSFQMGAAEVALPKDLPEGEHQQYGDPDEKPAHRVIISKAFYIGAFEVTNAQYEQFDPSHRQSRFSISRLSKPVRKCMLPGECGCLTLKTGLGFSYGS